MDINDYKQDRMGMIREVLGKYSCVIASKDAVTMVVDPKEKEWYINTSGNDGMAVAGSGDVLAGIIGALVAQKMPGFEAASLGVFLHGTAGDIACKVKGKYGMTAMDIIDQLPAAMGAEMGESVRK